MRRLLKRGKKPGSAGQPAPPPTVTTMGDPAASPTTAHVAKAFERALAGEVALPKRVKALSGMSGQRYRQFIHELVACTPDARYLEVGCWMGSTLCSAVDSNSVKALAIDNWSEFGGPLAGFFANLGAMDLSRASVSVTHADFRVVRWDAIGTYNIYLFDGPHEREDQHDGLALALPALDPEFVLIVDDWNWPKVREGTFAAIEATGLQTVFAVEVRSTINDHHPGDQGLLSNELSDWHNGYFFAVLKKTI